ncbi:MAG: hypothetical protein IPQ09_09185 [Myxococcales bacterium]|nr:hypothetical protein [Myxococcales bacterium]
MDATICAVEAEERKRERGTSSRGPKARDAAPLPPAVVAALSAAKSTDATGRPSATGGRALALVPVVVMLTLAALLFPRAVPPQELPLPRVDVRALEATAERDADYARLAERGLSDDTRVLGTKLRAFNNLQASSADESAMIAGRAALNHAIAAVLERSPAELKLLRAAQVTLFLRAVADFEATGVEGDELIALGGTFVSRLRAVGWIKERTVLPDAAVRAALYKLMWGATLNLTADATLDLSLDEQRAVHAFYILHPHPSDARRTGLAAAWAAAHAASSPAAACEEARLAEIAATEEWRLEKVRKLGTLDPDYPTSFALGIGLYRQRKYAASAEAFRDWLREHPTGPLALRAQNHLKAAIVADSSP